jgi:hypothetical protein
MRPHIPDFSNGKDPADRASPFRTLQNRIDRSSQLGTRGYKRVQAKSMAKPQSQGEGNGDPLFESELQPDSMLVVQDH